tara:strand:+ start:6210 stop:7211 length:1002 start_codon:yes stop_codon:yes gene_type:complete
MMNPEPQNTDPQQGGLMGFFKRMNVQNPQTGLTPIQKFGAALDSLVAPNQRQGDVIRGQGLARVGEQNKNRSIEALEKKASAGDSVASKYLDALKSGALDASQAFSGYLQESAALGRARITAGNNSTNVQRSSELPDGSGVVTVYRDGKVEVTTVGNRTIVGDEAEAFVKKAVQIANEQAEALYKARAVGGGSGKESVRFDNELAEMTRNLPMLEDTVRRLTVLSDTASYTAAGQLANTFRRQLGLDVGEGAIAKADYDAVVDNQILPLLRITFGSAFTEEEGLRLKATLGAPGASPAEKKAVLEAFINQRRAQLNSMYPVEGNDDPLGIGLD